ncbi:MAG: hypothetical protein HY513_03780 [Candidatus Aenigmarchaeota archaeon]|nr:hypothetical protein [Candidatus Aenigmarchaeota archaeon]
MEQELQNIGLTKSESKVYLALLDLGSSTSGPVIDKSGVASSKIYEILERLVQKGLVSFVIKGKTKYFEAASPERIMDYLEKKEIEVQDQKKEVQKILPRLLIKKQLGGHESEAKIYKGFKGVETAFYSALELMEKDETYYSFGTPSRPEKANKLLLKFEKIRAEKGVKIKMLLNENARDDAQIANVKLLGEVKYMPVGVITPAAINVFKDRTLIFPLETEKEPIVIEINNKDVAESFKAQFDILWNQQTRVYTGLDGPKLVLRDIVKTGKECLAMGIEEDNFKKIVPEALNEFIIEMDKKRIQERLICRQGTGLVRYKYMQARFLPEPYFSPLTVEIYGNKVALIDWTKPITTIIVEKKEIAEGYRKYFELLWSIAKK